MSAISIRTGTVRDAERISALVLALSVEFIVNEFNAPGRAHFLADHAPDAVRARLAGDFRFHLAEDAGSLAGVAAIRSGAHLYYLFVDKPYQRTGLAARLWTHARDEALASGNPGNFTVNASNYAIAAYEKLGFRRTQSTQEKNGVLYNPMKLVVARP
jgi:GNAT superfamily N-acetyltransferase